MNKLILYVMFAVFLGITVTVTPLFMLTKETNSVEIMPGPPAKAGGDASAQLSQNMQGSPPPTIDILLILLTGLLAAFVFRIVSIRTYDAKQKKLIKSQA
jgi:hypothetical protein